jgi:PadR family transcriptional regulator, regulatory protein PadR
MPRSKKTIPEASTNGAAPEDKASAFSPRLHGDMLSSSLLAFLRRWNAYGYQLVQELSKAGLANFDSTTVYRTLRQLERAGLVSSFWDTSESGPARRMYALTKAGETMLDLWLDLFGRYQRVLHSALDSLDNLNRPDEARPGEAQGAESRKGGPNARNQHPD